MHADTLHYIYDPLCGWCYAAAPLMDAATQIPGLKIRMHGGGLFAGANARVIGAQMRDFILSQDARIAALSGQEFGDDYKNGLLGSGTVLLDSLPPTRAVLVAERLAGQGLAMQRAIQRAHYISGKRVVEFATLRALAEQLGLDVETFSTAYSAMSDATVLDHMRQSRTLMEKHGGSGFPTFVLERNEQRSTLDYRTFLGKAPEWKRYLTERIRAA